MGQVVTTKLNDSEPLMTAREVAAYLNVTEAALYNWVKAGTSPRAFRVGTRLRFRREDVEAWLEERERR